MRFDDDARGERIRGAGEPIGQFESTAGLRRNVGRVLAGKELRNAAGHDGTGVVGFAALLDGHIDRRAFVYGVGGEDVEEARRIAFEGCRASSCWRSFLVSCSSLAALCRFEVGLASSDGGFEFCGAGRQLRRPAPMG